MMKRKLDENDIPTPVESPPATADSAAVTFESFGLDHRLLQGIADAGYSKPTSVQCQTIPAALDGKDVVARAHTGSGKTAAYLLPLLQSVIHQKQVNPNLRAVLALVLVPTKELAGQVYEVINQLGAHCGKLVKAVNISQKVADAVIRANLEESPEVVVATPARAMAHVAAGKLSLDKLLHLVVDEADLIMSYGHEHDLNKLAGSIPQSVQKTLMSATVSTELNSLEKLFCHDPVTIEIDQSKEEAERILQFAVMCGEKEKFLYLYAIFKLNLVKGKCLVFVHDIDRCYRLKLYLEQFGVRSCVLNSELPVNTRIHTVDEFNKNVYRIIIAADENEVVGSEHQASGDGEAVTANGTAAKSNGSKAKGSSKKQAGKTRRDREYGVSRGIDFKNVELVLNFDLPRTATSYTHRIGRTARAGQSGRAISFAVPREQFGKHRATSVAGCEDDEAALAAIEAAQAERGHEVRRWAFSDDVRAFEYRCGDALRAVTRAAVREARTRELRAELLNSSKLQRHFAENPDELAHLRHDDESHAVRTQAHLRHVPEYLMPGASGDPDAAARLGFVGPGRAADNPARKRLRDGKLRKRRAAKVVRDKQGRKDPLRTFNARGKGKK